MCVRSLSSTPERYLQTYKSIEYSRTIPTNIQVYRVLQNDAYKHTSLSSTPERYLQTYKSIEYSRTMPTNRQVYRVLQNDAYKQTSLSSTPERCLQTYDGHINICSTIGCDRVISVECNVTIEICREKANSQALLHQ